MPSATIPRGHVELSRSVSFPQGCEDVLRSGADLGTDPLATFRAWLQKLEAPVVMDRWPRYCTCCCASHAPCRGLLTMPPPYSGTCEDRVQRSGNIVAAGLINIEPSIPAATSAGADDLASESAARAGAKRLSPPLIRVTANTD